MNNLATIWACSSPFAVKKNARVILVGWPEFATLSPCRMSLTFFIHNFSLMTLPGSRNAGTDTVRYTGMLNLAEAKFANGR